MKYCRINIQSSIADPVKIDKPTVKETKRIMEIEQNQTHFQLEVKKKQSILDAALEQNVALDYKCKKGTCGKCKVKVVNGHTYLHPANRLEERKLNHLLQTGFRLACQATTK